MPDIAEIAKIANSIIGGLVTAVVGVAAGPAGGAAAAGAQGMQGGLDKVIDMAAGDKRAPVQPAPGKVPTEIVATASTPKTVLPPTAVAVAKKRSQPATEREQERLERTSFDLPEEREELGDGEHVTAHLRSLGWSRPYIETAMGGPRKLRQREQGVPRPRLHTVAADESLDAISRRYFGTTAQAVAIYQVNKDRIPNRSDLEEGTQLIIPDVPFDTRPALGKRG
jgi:nucleoid-associated protein YgaU